MLWKYTYIGSHKWLGSHDGLISIVLLVVRVEIEGEFEKFEERSCRPLEDANASPTICGLQEYRKVSCSS